MKFAFWPKSGVCDFYSAFGGSSILQAVSDKLCNNTYAIFRNDFHALRQFFKIISHFRKTIQNVFIYIHKQK